MSSCIAQDCSAANPTVVEESFSYFPSEIQEKLRTMGRDGDHFFRCVYCGTVWVNYSEFHSQRYIDRQLKIGTRELGSDNMIWLI